MSGRVIVLLHGSNGSAGQMEPLAEPLRKHARVLVPDLPGHGGRALPERLSIADAGGELVDLLDREGLSRAIFVGYSMGGYLAVWMARHHPDRTLGACAFATRFNFDAEVVRHWVHLAQPERIARVHPGRVAELSNAHGPGWPAVSLANAALFEDIGRNPPLTPLDWPVLARPVFLVNGNRDPFLPWSETLEAGKAIPNAKLAMFYGIAHPMRSAPLAQVAEAIGQWVQGLEES